MKDNFNALIIGASIVIAAIIISIAIIFTVDSLAKCEKRMMKQGYQKTFATAYCIDKGKF